MQTFAPAPALNYRRSAHAGSAARLQAPRRAAAVQLVQSTRAAHGTVLIGLAADSGCGKSTFMRRHVG